MSGQRIVSEWRASKPVGLPCWSWLGQICTAVEPIRSGVVCSRPVATICRAGAVRAGERVGDAGGAMDRRDPDHGGVGDDPGLAVAGDRDGAHGRHPAAESAIALRQDR